MTPLPSRSMTRRIKARYVREDPRGQRHVVLQVHQVMTFAFGGRRWEFLRRREFVLEGDPTGRGVNVLKDGQVFQIAHDRTIIRRVRGD